MGDYGYRVVNAVLASEFVPAKLRTHAMRVLGFDMAPDATVWAGANLRSRRMSLASGVFINVDFYFDGCERLTIGKNVRIGPGVKIITATHDIGPPHQRCLIDVVSAPVHIEDGCWVGAGVTILPGVVLGTGCVIAANTLVTKSTLPHGLYAGTPARRIRELPVGAAVRDHEMAMA